MFRCLRRLACLAGFNGGRGGEIWYTRIWRSCEEGKKGRLELGLGKKRFPSPTSSGSSRAWVYAPEDKEGEGGSLQKSLFRPFGPQFGLKIRGDPRFPGPLPWTCHCEFPHYLPRRLGEGRQSGNFKVSLTLTPPPNWSLGVCWLSNESLSGNYKG